MEQTTVSLEIKALSKGEFEGYGSVFGNVDYGGDIVMPGAFKQTLTDHVREKTLPVMFWMHQMDQVPGKWLHMEEDSTGLYVKGKFADTQLGRETHTLLDMKAVRGLSIGYQTIDRKYDDDGIRRLIQVDLHETSIVSLAMNPKAQITHAKSRLSALGEYVPTPEELAYLKRDAESFLQNKGFNRKLAVACAANLFKDVGEEVILEPKKDEEVILESKIPTPELVEVSAGLSNFNERLLMKDLEKSLERIFNNG